MPLSEAREPIVYKIEAEDGTQEALTFRRPTTRERMDGLANWSEKHGALETLSPGQREELYLGLGAEFLETATVPFTKADGTVVNIMEVDGWKDKLVTDAFYAPYFEKFVSRFFRLTVAD